MKLLAVLVVFGCLFAECFSRSVHSSYIDFGYGRFLANKIRISLGDPNYQYGVLCLVPVGYPALNYNELRNAGFCSHPKFPSSNGQTHSEDYLLDWVNYLKATYQNSAYSNKHYDIFLFSYYNPRVPGVQTK